MKILMLDAEYVKFTPTKPGLKEHEKVEGEIQEEDVILIFIHGEPDDFAREKDVLKKLLKNIKWLAGKLNKRKVILHSFAHLSEAKGDPTLVKKIIQQGRERLENVGFTVKVTPFGWFFDLETKLIGHSLGRIFKDI
ncbi:MAG: hypothetical protein J7J61_05170 [Candidatus Hydrothermae bacterium]|nr:hypothetical protein [Candidatus Hydrothermae bacterium]